MSFFSASAAYGKFNAIIGLLCALVAFSMLCYFANSFRGVRKTHTTEVEGTIKRHTCSTEVKKNETRTSCNARIQFKDGDKEISNEFTAEKSEGEGDKVLLMYPKGEPDKAWRKDSLQSLDYAWPGMSCCAVCILICAVITVIGVFSNDGIASSYGFISGVSQISSAFRN